MKHKFRMWMHKGTLLLITSDKCIELGSIMNFTNASHPIKKWWREWSFHDVMQDATLMTSWDVFAFGLHICNVSMNMKLVVLFLTMGQLQTQEIILNEDNPPFMLSL